MSQPLRTYLAPRHKSNRTVTFSTAKPSVRIIPADYTSWPNGETSKSPAEYDVIHAKALTKQALEAAAAEEKRDWERARTGRRPAAMQQQRPRNDAHRPRAKSSVVPATAAIPAALEGINSSRRYSSQTQQSPALYANPPSPSRVHRKPPPPPPPARKPALQVPMRNPNVNRSAPDLRSPDQGIGRVRSWSNVEAPLSEPKHHVGNMQSREKIEMRVAEGLRFARGFAKKFAGQAVDKFEGRHSQNG